MHHLHNPDRSLLNPPDQLSRSEAESEAESDSSHTDSHSASQAVVDGQAKGQASEQLQNYCDRLKAFEHRNRQLKALISAIPQIIWIADSDGRLIDVSQQWFEQTGLTMQDFTRSGFFSAVHPDDQRALSQKWQQAVQKQEPCQADVRLRTTDGSYQWYVLQARPLYSTDYYPTEVSPTEEPSVYTGLTGASSAGEASTAPAIADDPLAATAGSGDSSPDGQGHEPQVAEWVGTLTNAERLKQAEGSLMQEKEFLKALLANLSDGIVACDANGVLTLLNRAAEEFHQLAHQALPVQNWAEHYGLYRADSLTPLSVEEVPLYRALRGESVRDVEMRIVPQTGEPRIVLASGDAIVTPNGSRLGAVVAMKDITQRKQAEAALRSLNTELEARVQQRTQELEQSYQELRREMDARTQAEQLLREQNQLLMQKNHELERQRQKIQQQNIQLTEASRMKSRFLATMSHELRTPMNAIIGFSQLLLRQRRSPLSPQREEMVKRILNNGKKLLAMVNELLDFSKVEAGRLELNPQRLDLQLLISNTVEELRSLAEFKPLDIQVDVRLSQVNIINDPVRLRQIVVNLLSNAIKFTERGHVRISAFDLEGDRLAITVEDTGIGMTPETINVIFQPFQQADQSDARQFSGTGLGLAIVDSLVQMMGGMITVESQLGQGSTFRVELPRVILSVNSDS